MVQTALRPPCGEVPGRCMITHYRIRMVTNILEADGILVFGTAFLSSSPSGHPRLILFAVHMPFPVQQECWHL